MTKTNSFGRVAAATAKKLSDFQKKPALNDGEVIMGVSTGEIQCIKQIRNRNNPGFTKESLEELGDDIQQNGQIEPAILRPHPNPESGFKYLMVAGERRYLACEMKGILLKAVVRELTDAQAKRIQRSENVHSENLTQLDIALALKADKEELGTLQAVADEWNKSLNWVAERIAYLENVTSDGASRDAVTKGITADISTVNDLARLDRLNNEVAADLLQRADANPDMNLRTEVRTALRTTKALRVHGGAKPKPKPAGPALLDDELDKLREANTVLAAQLETLQSEVDYLKAELDKARAAQADNWKAPE